MAREDLYYIIHKPYRVLSQFTDENGNPGLGSRFTLPKDVYPVGRLDLDSEGLLILTNDRSLNSRLLHPKHAHQRTYWVEVDGAVDEVALTELRSGVEINVHGKVHRTAGAEVSVIHPDMDERDPPVNYRKHPKRTWLEVKLTEGKNRQLRRMTAKAGHPTLRLVRVAIESLELGSLRPGDITRVSKKMIYRKLNLV